MSLIGLVQYANWR